MKILFTADQHITLRKSKVKREWAKNRYDEYFAQLRKIEHDILILGGDLFDKRPTIEEVSVFLDAVCKHSKPIYLIAGNHEASTKYDTFLKELAPLQNFSDSKLKLMLNDDSMLEFPDVNIYFMTYQYIKLAINPPSPDPNKKSILITHARGDLAFTKPEYDFSRFKKYNLVLIGDLHTYHREKYFDNVWYPGSPYTITFHKESIPHGVFIVDTEKPYTPEFIELDLPQLVKIEVRAKNKVVTNTRDKDCVITEITGTADELSKIANSDNVVRKLEVQNTATVPLEGLSKINQLRAVLTFMGIKQQEKILEAYNEIT